VTYSCHVAVVHYLMSPFLYAVFVGGMLESVRTECANSGILAGEGRPYRRRRSNDQAAASSTPISLRRILDAIKRHGDTWGCCANFDKTNVVLVGPPDAAADARCHDFHLGSFSLTMVGLARYLGIWLTSFWRWSTHVAAAYRKGLGAFHSWRRVPMLPVVVQLRNCNHSLCHSPRP
jgi:hypothetical protein